MIEINLAPGPEGRRAKKRRSTQAKAPSVPSIGGDPRMVAAGAVGVLLLVLVAFAFWRQAATQGRLEARIQQEVTDSTRYATTIALIQSLQARQDTIQQKISVIREVDQRRFVWPHLLDEISRSVPAYTWLAEVTSTEAPRRAATEAEPAPAPAGPSLTLQGNAGSTQALTRLMKNLEASPFIRDVTLVTSEQVSQEGRSIHRFTLEARFEEPSSAEIETIPIVVVN